jgi:hypothetical protein
MLMFVAVDGRAGIVNFVDYNACVIVRQYNFELHATT